jgi:hypothetical protein
MSRLVVTVVWARQMSRLVVTVVWAQRVPSGIVWRPVECGTNGTEVAALVPGTCRKEREDGSSIVSLATVSKYPALEMLMSWFRLHFVLWVYRDFIQWADRPTGLPVKTAYIYC